MNFLASENVFALAEEKGWWKLESGKPFVFCDVYADRNALYSRRREWRVLSQAAPSLKLDPNAENYPLSVKAEKKLSVPDVLVSGGQGGPTTAADAILALLKRQMVKEP